MKQKLRNYLKLGILLFGISCFLTDCQKDFNDNIEVETKSRFRIQTLNQEQIQLNQAITKKLNEVRPKNKIKNTNNLAREIYNQEYGFRINTDAVKYILDTETGKHSYSFPIVRDSIINDNLENLLLNSNSENGYDAYIIHYGFTAEQYVNMNEDTVYNYITHLYPIDFETSDITTLDLSRIVYECHEEWSWMIIHHGDRGELVGAGNEDPPEMGWALTGMSCGYFDNGSGGGGDGGTSSGTGSGDGDPSSGSNGSTGSGTDPSDPSNTGNGGVIAAPAFDDDFDQSIYCQKMSVLKNDDVFKQKMVILKNAAAQWSFEKLFTLYNDPTPNSLPSQSDNYDYGEFQGSISIPSANWSGDSSMKGLIHSHYNGLLSILSPTDLMDLYNIMSDPFVTSDFFYGVVTHSGTAYILQIKDRNAFLAFGNKNFTTQRKFEAFEQNIYNKKYNIKHDNSVSTNRLGFVKMLIQLNAGLNIYEATDLTFTDYKKLEFNNNQVTENNCN